MGLLSSAGAAISGTVGTVGVTVTAGTSGTSGTSTPTAPAAPSTPVTASYVPVGTSAAAWNMQSGETIYFNSLDPATVGPTAWLPMIVRYVFADGNAVLTADPNCVVYTGGLIVGANLRRKSETYNSSYPGP